MNQQTRNIAIKYCFFSNLITKNHEFYWDYLNVLNIPTARTWFWILARNLNYTVNFLCKAYTYQFWPYFWCSYNQIKPAKKALFWFILPQKRASVWRQFNFCALLVVWGPGETVLPIWWLYADISTIHPSIQPSKFYLKTFLEVVLWRVFAMMFQNG